MKLLKLLVFIFIPITIFAQPNPEVVIYGATPSGIFAAINVAREGHTVVLVEEYRQIGGLMTGGLSFTDFISQEALSGTFNEYRFRVLAYYEDKYGKESQQVKDCYFGVNSEPHVTELIFKEMLDELPAIKIYTQHRISKAEVIKLEDGHSKIQYALSRFLNSSHAY